MKKIFYILFILLITIIIFEIGFYLGAKYQLISTNPLLRNKLTFSTKSSLGQLLKNYLYSLSPSARSTKTVNVAPAKNPTTTSSKKDLALNQLKNNYLKSLSLSTYPIGTTFDPFAFKHDFTVDIASRAADRGILLQSKLSFSYRGILSRFDKNTTITDSKGKKMSDIFFIVLKNPETGREMKVAGGRSWELDSMNVMGVEKNNDLISLTIDDVKIGDYIQYKEDIDLIQKNKDQKNNFIINREILVIRKGKD